MNNYKLHHHLYNSVSITLFLWIYFNFLFNPSPYLFRRECPAYSGIGHLVSLFEKSVPEKEAFEMPADRKKRVRHKLNMILKLQSYACSWSSPSTFVISAAHGFAGHWMGDVYLFFYRTILFTIFFSTPPTFFPHMWLSLSISLCLSISALLSLSVYLSLYSCLFLSIYLSFSFFLSLSPSYSQPLSLSSLLSLYPFSPGERTHAKVAWREEWIARSWLGSSLAAWHHRVSTCLAYEHIQELTVWQWLW